MKLEVDLNDKNQLQRVEAELVRSLDLVRAALKQHESSPIQTLNPPWNAESMIEAAVKGQGIQFNSSAIYEPMLAQGISREVIKAALARLVESKVIKVNLPGKGRRPTAYEKLAG